MSFYGHIGDSNLHIAVSVGAPAEEAELHEDRRNRLRLVGSTRVDFRRARYRRAKRDYLAYSRRPEELELMRRIKATLDPNSILNPGKVLTG